MNLILSKTPPYLEEKIWACLLGNNLVSSADFLLHYNKNVKNFTRVVESPVLHIIVADNFNQWKPGKIIRIKSEDNTETQLMPDFKCVSTQKIHIKYKRELSSIPMVFVDDNNICESEIKILSKNCGFDSTYDFCEYFKENFKGKIIHWTRLRYAE